MDGLTAKEADCFNAILTHPRLFAIAKACDEATRSLGFSYSPCELWRLAWFNEDNDEEVIAIYRAVAALGERP
jgi:hypothetical protein